MTASPWAVGSCRGCGRVIRRKRLTGSWFCTRSCERSTAQDAEVRLLATTPMHVLYPGMMAHLTRVQEQRPSYTSWSNQ